MKSSETTPTQPAPRIEPSPVVLRQIQDLYDRDLLLQAYRLSEQVGPLQHWRGTEARVLAGRLARALDGSRLGMKQIAAAYRADRHHPLAIYYYAEMMPATRGLLAARLFVHRHLDRFENAPDWLRADWYLAVAKSHSNFRDFELSVEWMERAEKTAPGHVWVWTQKSYWLEAQDRHAESLESCERALSLRPHYRPAVSQKAILLQRLQRHDEALATLVGAVRHIESPSVAQQLANLHVERGELDDALRALDRYEQLAVCRESAHTDWLAGRRADIYRMKGDIAQSLAHARKSTGSFFKKIVAVMEAAPVNARRVLLPVPSVRQDRHTCAPATLTALCRYWSANVEHTDIVAEICYDGTNDHSERHWVEQNGFVAREFRVTWDAARALLDRGLPFALGTVETNSAHLQGIIGYDELRHTLLIREPSSNCVNEATGDGWLNDYRSSGPRGMAIVPRDKADLLDGIDLPEAALYDLYYRLQRALVSHDRNGAARALETMDIAAPGHRMTLQARKTLASYDDDYGAMVDCYDKLLEMFPGAGHLQLGKLGCLRRMTRRDDAVAFLTGIISQEKVDAVFWHRYASLIGDDNRAVPVALHWLRRAMRREPVEGLHYHAMANILWDIGRFSEALEVYRLAACLNDKDEHLAMSYFRATRFFHQTETGLAFLRDRVNRAGARSGDPVRSVFDACELLDRQADGFAALEEVMRLRPDDGDLMLFAARGRAANGQHDAAARLIDAARDKSSRSDWLRTAADLAGKRDECQDALALWREIAALQPMSVEAHRNIAELLARLEGDQAARDHLAGVAGLFPHHHGIHRLRVQWLRDAEPAEREVAARHLLSIDPLDSWARRELAVILEKAGRHDEALAESDAALALAPGESYNHFMRGWILELQGREADASASYRQAIRMSADTEDAIDQLLGLCETTAERREALAFVLAELERQVLFGDGLLAYRRCARSTLPSDELLGHLQAANRARPDLWHSWSALIQQYIQDGRSDDAWQAALEATGRFPLLPRLWWDRADAALARKDSDAEVESLRQALTLNPNWSAAMRRLSETWQRAGNVEREHEILQRAVSRDPRDEFNRGYLADVLWRMDRKPEALDQLREAVTLAPGYEWAWDQLAKWGNTLGQPGLALDLARTLTGRRPGEARSWSILSRYLPEDGDAGEYLSALERAIALNPRLVTAHDSRAWKLSRLKRYDEALAACCPPAWGDEPPLLLQARAAWIEAERGNRKLAIDRTRAVVEQDPDYYWAWTNLADWYAAENDNDRYLEAGQALVRIAPSRAIPYGYRGDAFERMGRKDKARADFEKAIEIDPEYSFAAASLFDLQLATKQYDDAARTLEVLVAHTPDDFTRARQVQLAARLGDRKRAAELLPALCDHEPTSRWPLDTATDAMIQAGMKRAMMRVLWRCLDFPGTSPRTGAIWINNLVCFQQPLVMWKLVSFVFRRWFKGVGLSAAYVRALAEGGHPGWLWWYTLLFWSGLQSDTRLWGNVGHAHLALGLIRLGRRWIRGWHTRENLKPWMLVNVSQILLASNDVAEAVRVGQHALMLPEDHATNATRVQLALAQALTGQFAEADTLLREVDPKTLDSWETVHHALANSLTQVALADPANRHAAFRNATRDISLAVIDCHKALRDVVIRRCRRRCLLKMAQLTGTIRAWVYYLWDTIGSRIET